MPPTCRAIRSVSTMRSATGSARVVFRRWMLESKWPDAATSRANPANAGRSSAGAESARLATASGSDIPARTEAMSRSQTSGQSPRRVRRSFERRARSQANGAIAPAAAATTASAATGATSHAMAAATTAHTPATTTIDATETRAIPASSSSRAIRPR